MVGDHPVDSRQFTRRALVRVLGLRAGAGGLGERAAGGLDLPGQLGVLAPRPSGPLLQRLGFLAARRGLRGCFHGHLLGGGHERAAQAFRQRREFLPVGGRALQGRRGRPLGVLQAHQLRAGSRDSFLKGRPQRRRLFVRGLERRQLRTRRRQVIRQQPGLRVAHACLNEGGPLRQASGAGQGAELAVDLVGQVQDAHEVCVHVRQFLQRTLLAAPVLEDPGGLLDEAAPLLGSRGQDRVELPLADDDVHLAAHARVGEQLLDVQEAHGRAVDGILRPAAAEQGAADRHLGILDVEQPVGVVDRQVHLGAPQRRAPGCPRKDDVRHLAAAQRAGALLAHHPGERVNDIRLTRPVGAHDARDARLERERGRAGEGLEPPQRQVLEVHPCRLPAA